jgi:hypothetical protein
MRGLVLTVLVTACATDASPPEETPVDPFEAVWTEAIRPGDLFVVVPGTGSHNLGAMIESAAPAELDARSIITWVDPLEGAIAMAERAGLSGADLEAGAVTFALWGSNITKLTSFRYKSVSGLHLTFEVLGGTSTCGSGSIPDNLPNYNATNADKDARELYKLAQTFLARSPSTGRNVIMAAHSWGGLVAEYFATHLATYTHDHGPLAGQVAFIAAAGVPAFVPGFSPLGPGFRTVDTKADEITASPKVYEVDRADDPVHSFALTRNGNGHHYIIMFGEAYQGWYGITTNEMSCGATPGMCP